MNAVNNSSTRVPVVGRFAPSPSGLLHFGSLVAALGSWLDARAQNGRWLLRIEDIDPPREMPGASAQILRQLDAFGLYWDGPVLFQSRRHDAYDAVLQDLRARDLLFACDCTRHELQGHRLYPGRCRERALSLSAGRSWRLHGAHRPLPFSDGVHGLCRFQDAENDDFMLRRRDGLYAYALAVVVDDIAQGVTDVVRGADLLATTPRQIHLWQTLGTTPPHYLHLPLVLDARGQKLSKQNLAPVLNSNATQALLLDALQVLGQTLPEQALNQQELLQFALQNWQRSRIPCAPCTQASAERGVDC